jgi:two-component sensor histidine kinase
VLQIIREALSNVTRHARAHRVQVRLQTTPADAKTGAKTGAKTVPMTGTKAGATSGAQTDVQALFQADLQADIETDVGPDVQTLQAVQVEVRDDGGGIMTAPSQRGHYGLSIMRERARSLGGELRIESAPEQGTRLLLRFRPRAQSGPQRQGQQQTTQQALRPAAVQHSERSR